MTAPANSRTNDWWGLIASAHRPVWEILWTYDEQAHGAAEDTAAGRACRVALVAGQLATLRDRFAAACGDEGIARRWYLRELRRMTR